MTQHDVDIIVTAIDAEDYSTHVLTEPRKPAPRLREWVLGAAVYGLIVAVGWWRGLRRVRNRSIQMERPTISSRS